MFSKFLVAGKHHERGVDVAIFELNNLKFDWFNQDKQNDCGVYVMKLMELFNGVRFKSADLTQVMFL